MMTAVALFNSVLGVWPGIVDAAERLRSHGHHVQVVDQYDGKVFDDYEEADSFAQNIGYDTLMKDALDAVAGIDGPFTVAGFSNGGGMAAGRAPSAARRSASGGAAWGLAAKDADELGPEHAATRANSR
jgi:dienelactone hydrolase